VSITRGGKIPARFDYMAPQVRNRRWVRRALADAAANKLSAEEELSESRVPPPPTPAVMRPQRAAPGTSHILQHYHATGCSGGAFSWRGAMMDPTKGLHLCTEPREYRKTTLEDIAWSKADKRRGGGPRVGPFQEAIPGNGWSALPKYDFTSRKRSTAFNERMHVEWENHADHILANGGELPTASVVAKAGFRSCAPCCRDMLALARPTGKTFIMVDLADEDSRGTFHFVTGDKYMPVPKEACTQAEVSALKKVVLSAQDDAYSSSQEIYDAVLDLGVPIDEAAQSFYLADRALLPTKCALGLRGEALLEVLHAEHFARLPAEYGASILRDADRPKEQREAVLKCRARAKQMLIDAWRPHLSHTKIDLEEYAAAAVAPLLPEDPGKYAKMRRSVRAPAPRQSKVQLTVARLQAIDEDSQSAKVSAPMGRWVKKRPQREDDVASATTAAPDDAVSQWSEQDDAWEA
jgi:hypothetical protein